jgi:rhodanese-related sulfurtransferase
MGPLVPEIITDELNLVIALLLGIAFGFVLEQAGFSSSRKLTGLFYGTDFTVLRVFFTAGVTAMAGVLLLTQFGWLDADLIYINPTFLHSAILGGAIMGVGFVVGGYCPGTSFCGAAVGRIDAMAFAAGGALGIFAYGEAFPLFQDFQKAGAKGDLLVSTALGLSNGQFAAIMILVAVGAFVFTTRIEKKVNPESSAFRFPVARHVLAGTALFAVALLLVAMPERKARLTAKVEDPVFLEQHPVRMLAPDELAIHVLDRDPKIQLIDARDPAAYAKATLPGAVNLPLGSLFGKDSKNSLAGPRTLKVFFAKDEADGIRAAALARLTGAENVAALEGGLDGFMASVVNASTSDVHHVDAETQSFRLRAGTEIAAMIKQQSGPKPVKAVRRVQGGCGG